MTKELIDETITYRIGVRFQSFEYCDNMELTIIEYSTNRPDCEARGKNIMKSRIVLVIVLFFVLGSATVSSMDFLSYTFKSIFYGGTIFALVIIGLVGLYQYFKRDKSQNT